MDRDDQILDYLQNRLSAEEKDRFERALQEDAALAAEVAVMRAVRAELDSGPEHKEAEAVWNRLSDTITPPQIPANTNRSPWRQVVQYAAVAMVAVAFWQVAVVPRINEQPTGFQAASEQSDLPTLQVRFAETATMGEITALLSPLNGMITDGPSALGLVHVSFPDTSSRAKALEELRRRSDVVTLVQPQ